MPNISVIHQNFHGQCPRVRAFSHVWSEGRRFLSEIIMLMPMRDATSKEMWILLSDLSADIYGSMGKFEGT